MDFESLYCLELVAYLISILMHKKSMTLMNVVLKYNAPTIIFIIWKKIHNLLLKRTKIYKLD